MEEVLSRRTVSSPDQRERSYKPLISVIVPVYKVEPYIRQCVESILNQTYSELEILLIDDGSPDQCGAICDDFAAADDRVKVFHTENRGLSAARNLGLEAAAGEHIGFVDPDDWIEPDMFEIMLEKLQETGADICVCGYYLTTARAVKTRTPTGTVYSGTDALIALSTGKINNYMWNKLYRRDVIHKSVSSIAVFPEGRNYEDLSVMHRIIAAAGSVSAVKKPLYHYRIRPGSISKLYTARNLIDYAEAHLARYNYYMDERPGLSSGQRDKVLFIAATGICKVWRWWYACDENDKRQYADRIASLARFSRDNFPFFGFRAWPVYMRLSAAFMRADSKASFAVLYYFNQLYRRLCPGKANII